MTSKIISIANKLGLKYRDIRKTSVIVINVDDIPLYEIEYGTSIPFKNGVTCVGLFSNGEIVYKYGQTVSEAVAFWDLNFITKRYTPKNQ